MRQLCIALTLAATLAGCVQTRQYADVMFEPPSGDYKLLVMRPDVSVGSVTTGGLTERRADWTETARGNLVEALRAQQGTRGGNVTILERRDELRGVSAEEVAEIERLNGAVGELDRAPQISGRTSADQARPRARLDAGRGRRRAGPQDRPRLCALPLCRGQLRLDRPGRAPGARRRRLLRRFLCAEHGRAAGSSPTPRWSIFAPARSSWFNVARGAQPGRRDQVRRHSHARRRRDDGRAAARPDEAGQGDARRRRRHERAQPPPS